MVCSLEREPHGMALRLSRRGLVAGALGTALAARIGGEVFAGQTPDGDGRERLRSLLSLVPNGILLEGNGAPWFTWCDLRSHFTAAGLEYPLVQAPPGEVLRVLADPDGAFMLDMEPAVAEVLGFSVRDVHQILTIGTPPNGVWMFRGGADFPSLTETWEAGGYERVSREWGEIWTKSEEGEQNFDDPVQRVSLGKMNNIAVLDDTTIVASRTADKVGEIVQVGDGKTVAESVMIAPLIDAMLPDAASVMMFSGELLSLAGLAPMPIGVSSVEEAEGTVEAFEENLRASDEAAGSMPRILSMMGQVAAGVVFPEDDGAATPVAGQEPGGRIALLTGSEEAAEDAVAVMFWRYENMDSLETGEPYREMFTVVNDVDTATQRETAFMDLAPADAAAGAWHNFIWQRDYLPFAW